MTKLFYRDLQTTSCHAMRAGGVVLEARKRNASCLPAKGTIFVKWAGAFGKSILQAKQMKIKRRTHKGLRGWFLGKTL